MCGPQDCRPAALATLTAVAAENTGSENGKLLARATMAESNLA
jgi:hypothetical protein